MYAPVPVAGSTGRRGLWPLAAICCLGILGLLIAATIILALIPVYIRKNIQSVGNSNSANQLIYIQYQSPANINSGTAGSIDNIGDLTTLLNNLLGLNGDATIVIQTGQMQPTFVRRKRAHQRGRAKRDLIVFILFVCKVKFRSTCNGVTCQTNAFQRVMKTIQKGVSIPSLSIRIRNIQRGLITFTYSLTFIGLFSAKPIGFGGESSTLQFVAVSSGAFNNPLTWAGGIVPYGPCSVIIPAGVTVTLTRATLELNVLVMSIYGSLTLGGSSFSSFTFYYPTNIIVNSGGSLQDQTSGGQINCPSSSIITIYPGGTFAGSNTVISTYTSLPAASSIVASFVLGPSRSGPFTCGLLPSGQIVTFMKVTYIAVTSGDFLSPGTWLGGIVPTEDVAMLVGGLGLYVAPGCTLGTAGLNGFLNIQFDVITVAVSAVMQLGTPGLLTGFRFGFPCTFNVYGQVVSVTGGTSGIYFPVNSVFNLYPGAMFTSLGGGLTSIYSYSVATGQIIGTPLLLGTSMSGPFSVTILVSGVIITSTTVPGTTASPTATTSASVTGPVAG